MAPGQGVKQEIRVTGLKLSIFADLFQHREALAVRPIIDHRSSIIDHRSSIIDLRSPILPRSLIRDLHEPGLMPPIEHPRIELAVRDQKIQRYRKVDLAGG